jgi:hypothetical protein
LGHFFANALERVGKKETNELDDIDKKRDMMDLSREY